MTLANQDKRALRRQIGILVFLGILIWMINQLYGMVLDWRYVLTGTEGSVIYVAAFDGFGDEWQQYQGRRTAEVIDNALELRGDDGTFYSVAQPTFADFDIQMDVQALENPNDNGYGVVFRLQDPQNLYFFFISSDGYYRVSRVVNNTEKRLSTWIPSEHIKQGLNTVNRIRVVGLGNLFQFFINDQPVPLCIPDSPDGESTYSGGQCFGTMTQTLLDDTFSSGQLGVVIQATGDDMRVRFDNVVVYQPEVTSFVYSLFERFTPQKLVSPKI